MVHVWFISQYSNASVTRGLLETCNQLFTFSHYYPLVDDAAFSKQLHFYFLFFSLDLDAFAPAFCPSWRGFSGLFALSGGSAFSLSLAVGTLDTHFWSLRFFPASFRLLTLASAISASHGNHRRFSSRSFSGRCSSAEDFLALSCSSFETRATLESRDTSLWQPNRTFTC